MTEEQPPASFPNFVGKHDHDALFSPEHVVRDFARFAERDWTVPEGIVLFYSGNLARSLEARSDVAQASVPITYPTPTLYTFEGTSAGAVGGFGVGSPAAAMVLETLIALGCKRVINIGLCGGIQPDLPVGAIAVGTSAVRDEGVSHHYLPSSLYVEPSPALTIDLTRELDARGLPYRLGSTWTIDAVYRETVAEMHHYRDLGVLTVEMEAAAVYAVGRFRNIDVTGAFVVADVLHEEGWRPEGLWAAEPRQMLEQLLEASIATLAQRS
jgi:uridine phosphorylase